MLKLVSSDLSRTLFTTSWTNRMQSFVFAETFKYYYLLFAPAALDFDAVTFNTEAHPLRATWLNAHASAPAMVIDAAP
jgi:hypothetical protein